MRIYISIVCAICTLALLCGCCSVFALNDTTGNDIFYHQGESVTENTSGLESTKQSYLKRWDYSKPVSFNSLKIVLDPDTNAQNTINAIGKLVNEISPYEWKVVLHNNNLNGSRDNWLTFDGCLDVTIAKDHLQYYYPYCVLSRTDLEEPVPLSALVSIIKCLEEHQNELGFLELRLADWTTILSIVTTASNVYYKNADFKDSYLTDKWKSKWYLEAVQYVLFNELMNGYEATTWESSIRTDQSMTITNARDIGACFRPNETATRAQTAQVFYNMYGAQTVKDSKMPFTDVDRKWYYDAVAWAYENEIVNGMSETEFGIEKEITREQFVTMLYRYAQFSGEDVTDTAETDSFGDADLVSEYAEDAVSWAVSKGYLKGTDVDGVKLLNPLGSITRAEMAALLMRYDRAQS